MNNRALQYGLVAALCALAFLMLVPFIVTFTNSFMSQTEIAIDYGAIGPDAAQGVFANLKWIPDRVSLEQYKAILLEQPQYLRMFWNSAGLVLPIVLGQAAVSAMAAYAFAKLHFPGRDKLFLVYVVTMLMPFQVTLVPNYIALDKLGLLNCAAAIILPGIFSAFGVFLLRQFLSHVPRAYIEAAKIDGAGQAFIFARIVVPLAMPGIAALFMLAFVDNWNMVEQPLLFLQDPLKQPLSLFLSRIVDGQQGVAFSAGVLYMAPMLFVFLNGEKELIQGIQLSGMKG
ncbi:carbohydrate ABC transporter permease [Paenibacillus glycinis]|uniref:ABC transporter permease subunit n=1 Tax=Paenibacillus glycinis TaxID=2697035 RepID=A0ABW9Y0A2_9BACL|nr:carbohydrate ABC transporter permease [Paenibacillus glycinis]NBD27867.1 ABC transporter permease subunit [Paenibacillus glycinis]